MSLSHFSFPSDFKCMEALGMESGEIHSDQITASSQYSTNWSAERSRLNYPENGWTPGEDSYKEWIQVCSIRCSTFLVEEFSHLERLVNKGSAMPNAFKWEEKAHVQSQHRTIGSLYGQGKANPDDVPENSCTFSYVNLHRIGAQTSHFGNNKMISFFPTTTRFLPICSLLQQIFISLMKYINPPFKLAWNNCILE